MKQLLAPLALLGAALVPTAGQLEVDANPENVVSSRLAGTWVLDGPLTSRMRGKDVEGGERRLVFEADASALNQVPSEFVEFLSEEPIHLAGTLEQWGTVKPFVLTVLNGNPHVIAFEADGSILSFNLSIAPALLETDDVLFVGGDRNNQPFDAFVREAGSYGD